MNTELFILIILLAIGGFGLSAGSLTASCKSTTSDGAAGYGFLAFVMFAGTIVAIGVMLFNMGAFRGT